MNILFHCWEFPPHGSGVGSYVSHMTKAFQKRGHFTIVVTSHGDEGQSEERSSNGVVFRAYKMQDIGKQCIIDLVLQLAEKYNVDWIEGVDRLGESSGVISSSRRPPVVIKAHYNDVLNISRYGHAHYFWQKIIIDLACWRYRERILREKISLGQADVLLAPCTRILQELETQGVNLPDQRFTVPNPITPISGWSNLEAREPTLLFIGRIDLGKGIAHLSGIIDLLKGDFPTLTIEIAGEDSYARLIGSTRDWLVRKLGSNITHIRFLGHLDQKGLDDAYARAWVVIVPSEWDTFPTVVLESMVRKKSIVASHNGGMPEMLDGTDNSVADPTTGAFAQEVGRFISSKKLRMTAGSTGHEKAIGQYNPEKIVDDYVFKISDCGMIGDI